MWLLNEKMSLGILYCDLQWRTHVVTVRDCCGCLSELDEDEWQFGANLRRSVETGKNLRSYVFVAPCK